MICKYCGEEMKLQDMDYDFYDKVVTRKDWFCHKCYATLVETFSKNSVGADKKKWEGGTKK